MGAALGWAWGASAEEEATAAAAAEEAGFTILAANVLAACTANNAALVQ